MNLATQDRLRTIDFLLDHFGYVQRPMLMDFYGISTPQASMDFKAYMEAAPGNMAYDLSQRKYIKQVTFVRRFP